MNREESERVMQTEFSHLACAIRTHIIYYIHGIRRYVYSKTSVAQTLMARLSRLFRTRS